MSSFFSSNFTTNIKVKNVNLHSVEIKWMSLSEPVHQTYGQKTNRKHTKIIVEINTAPYRIDIGFGRKQMQKLGQEWNMPSQWGNPSTR